MNLEKLPPEKPFCEFMELIRASKTTPPVPVCVHPSKINTA